MAASDQSEEILYKCCARMLYTRTLMDLTPYIRNVQDFPVDGILFRDITPLLSDPVALRYAVDRLEEMVRGAGAESIVGIESRGFIFGAPLALRLGVPFVPIRKPGKLPAARMSVEYALEYGQGQLDIHADSIAPGTRVVIVDDLLATGGTARAAAKLVELTGGLVVGFVFAIELKHLDGRERLIEYPVHSLIAFE